MFCEIADSHEDSIINMSHRKTPQDHVNYKVTKNRILQLQTVYSMYKNSLNVYQNKERQKTFLLCVDNRKLPCYSVSHMTSSTRLYELELAEIKCTDLQAYDDSCAPCLVDLYFLLLFYSLLSPFQDYFSTYEPGESVGGAKTGESSPLLRLAPGKQTSRTWLFSRMKSSL